MKSAGSGFFHIDRRIWNLLCNRQNINMAVAYLCVATGTGGGNRTSFWSAQAIEKYTGLHNSRAKKVLDELIAAGFMCRDKESSRTRPRYEFQDYSNVLESIQYALAAPHEAVVITRVCKGQKLSKSDRVIAERLRTQGLLWRALDGFTAKPPSVDLAVELIWLPNSLVIGTPHGEAPPVKRLRSYGDLWALRLLIDLYQAQNLSADGGISRSVLRYEYEKKRYGQRGRHVIWGFTAKQGWATSHPCTRTFWDRKATEKLSDNPIFPTLQVLLDMGLVRIVPHLVENSSNDCEIIHALGSAGVGEEVEQELGKAAEEAARYLLNEQQLHRADNVVGVEMLVPVWQTQADVQVVGVYRLTYRPQTRLTADWYRRMNERATEWLENYKRLGPPVLRLPPASGFEDW